MPKGVSSVTQQCIAAAQQMAANSSGVSNAIEEISAISRRNSASAEEMSAQVEEVVASAQSLDQMAQELQKAVSVFKLSENSQVAGVARSTSSVVAGRPPASAFHIECSRRSQRRRQHDYNH